MGKLESISTSKHKEESQPGLEPLRAPQGDKDASDLPRAQPVETLSAFERAIETVAGVIRGAPEMVRMDIIKGAAPSYSNPFRNSRGDSVDPQGLSATISGKEVKIPVKRDYRTEIAGIDADGVVAGTYVNSKDPERTIPFLMSVDGAGNTHVEDCRVYNLSDIDSYGIDRFIGIAEEGRVLAKTPDYGGPQDIRDHAYITVRR